MTRLPLTCSHRPPCPGCPGFARRGVDRAAFAALASLAERNGLPTPPVVEGPPVGFRHRARLSVRGRAQNPKIGIFEEGTHRLVHIPSCSVHHPLINDVANIVRKCLIDAGIAPYSDSAHLGDVRALQVVVERSSQTAQVVLTTRAREPEGLSPLFALVAERLGARLHSLFWNGQPERSNTVLGPYFRAVSGPETVIEVFGGTRIHYPPNAFGQSNLPVFEELARRAGSFVPDGTRVLELYAGSGALGLPMAARLTHLDMNEIGEGSLEGLRRGIGDLGPALATRLAVHPGSAADAGPLIQDADIVIVDPPRKGLEPQVLDALCQSPPERLVYVSCGLQSFLNEAERLQQSRALRLTALEIFALFPYTEHVETLAVFDRARRGPSAIEHRPSGRA